MNETELYYFSGTGNSLHAARELQKRLPEARLIALVGLLGQDTVKTDAKTVGFVFPLHLTTSPIPVREFFRKIDLSSAGYVFALVTRGGSQSIGVDKILKKRGHGLDALFFLNMADNDPKMKSFKLATAEELERIEAALQADLDVVAQRIARREKVGPEDDSPPQPLSPAMGFFARLGLAIADRLPLEESFYTDEKCTGCGTCEEVCPSGKIAMVNGEPAWTKDAGCYMCFACVDFCPEAAVQIASNRMKKSYTTVNARYHHPDITPEDIAAQKNS